VAALDLARTADLDPSFQRELRVFLDTAFDGDFSDEDWNSTIGGLHVWVSGASGLISHASLIERTLVCSGHTLRVGYVEAVATAVRERRKGHGTSVMEQIGDLIRDRYPLGVLSTGTYAFYESLGWERWRGLTFVDGPHGRERTPDDDDAVMILRTPRSPRLDLHGNIICDWRAGDVW